MKIYFIKKSNIFKVIDTIGSNYKIVHKLDTGFLSKVYFNSNFAFVSKDYYDEYNSKFSIQTGKINKNVSSESESKIVSLCDQIVKEYDKFENETIYKTPLYNYGKKEFEKVSFQKIVNGKIISYFISLNSETYGTSTGYGITILLENNKKIVKSKVKTDVSLGDGSLFSHSAFFVLTANDILLLKENSITDFRLYIHDELIEDGNRYKELFNCLVKAK